MNEPAPASWRSLMFRPLRYYADFTGRSGRREFWWYSLFLALGYLAIFFVGVVQAVIEIPDDVTGVTIAGGWLLFFAANFIPGLALTARRLHDLGLSGVLTLVAYLVIFVTGGLGWFAYLIVMSLPGQAKTNRWGDPLGARDVADVFA